MNSSTNHIAILCSYLNVAGGYEKAVVNTANLFAEKGNTVTLIILDETSESFYPINKNIRIIQEPLSFGITQKGNIVSRKIILGHDILKLRSILKRLQPTIVICTEYPFAVAAILGNIKKRARVFSWEHHHFAVEKRNTFWKFLYKLAYPKLDAIVCLNQDEKKHFQGINEKATVIPNFTNPVQETNFQPLHKPPVIISITRLNHIKGIDLLMEVAKKVLKQNSTVKWKIIGYGEKKDELLNFIKTENLSEQLSFQPAVHYDILSEYKRASICVMTSRNECFPLALLEAQSCGLPCIAFDCETGPRHIIKHNQNGILVEKENTQKLADSILSLINNADIRIEMSKICLQTVAQFYPDNVYVLWEKLFKENQQPDNL